MDICVHMVYVGEIKGKVTKENSTLYLVKVNSSLKVIISFRSMLKKLLAKAFES